MYPLTCFMLCPDDLIPSIFLKEGPQAIRFAMLQKTFDKESGRGTEQVLDTRPAWTSSMRGSQRQGGAKEQITRYSTSSESAQSRSLKTERQL